MGATTNLDLGPKLGGRACACAIAAVLGGCYSGLSGGADDADDGSGSAADDAADDGDGSSGATSDGEPGGVEPPVDRVAKSGLRRLTVREYDDTLRDILLDDGVAAAQQLPVDSLTPFDNDYTHQIASGGLIDATEYLAARAADRLLADSVRRDQVVGCLPATPDDEACMRTFVAAFGRRALRRPLSEDEIVEYLHGTGGSGGALDHAAGAGDFFVGVDTIVRTMLQEPEFLYRVEIGTPIPDEPGIFALSSFEVATRLSYLVWGSTPDDSLLDLAEADGLADADSVREAALDMLDDPRAVARIARFHAMWLGYVLLPHTAELSGAMQTETTALVERVVFAEERPWQDLFRSSETFVSDLLAEQYGLPLPGSTEPVWVNYGETGRQGILSHGSFLSIGAKFNDTSPVQRGKFVRERLFCQPLEEPPDSVDVDQPVAPEGAVCKVDRFAAHEVGNCAGCHVQIDPVGFGLENYDQFGRYREFEPDNPETEADESQCAIEGKGKLEGIGEFHGPGELSDLAIEAGLLNACVMTQLVRFTVGHSEIDELDQQLVFMLLDHMGDGDFRFDELVLELVSDDAFRFRREEE